MKKIILIAAATIMLVACSALYSCTKESRLDNVNSEEKTAQQKNASARSESEPILIATINSETGDVSVVYNEDDITNWLLESGTMEEVESVKVQYGSDRRGQEAYFTMVGKISGTSIAYQADLIVHRNNIYLPNPGSNANKGLFNSHSCAGSPCSSCSFTHGGRWGWKITGCQCNADGSCNHTIESGDVFGTVIQVFGVIAGLI